MRINPDNSLIHAISRGKLIQITMDGQVVDAYEGETIAAVLLAAGIWSFRSTSKKHQPRGIYCGMGLCHECLVTVNHVHAVRACVTQVMDGMEIETCKEVVL